MTPINSALSEPQQKARTTSGHAKNGTFLPSQATLRFLGHIGKNGGNLLALKAAEEYFPEGHGILRAYQSRCQSNLDNAPTQKRYEVTTIASRFNPESLMARKEYWYRRVTLGALKNKRR